MLQHQSSHWKLARKSPLSPQLSCCHDFGERPVLVEAAVEGVTRL